MLQHACTCNDVLPPRVAGCARCAFARLIDLEARRLPVERRVGDVAGRIVAALLAAFGKDGARPLDIPVVAAHDVLAIAKGIVDVLASAATPTRPRSKRACCARCTAICAQCAMDRLRERRFSCESARRGIRQTKAATRRARVTGDPIAVHLANGRRRYGHAAASPASC
ncbi:hypothetical protein WS71_05120 [Burkholderia mayonis]|uniref:Uncharacterized protein n=1 Tax=Burkholderia mayonis TaxID=1385591 RepID=A0A1B4FSZ9_9BURK|nr:hypothetical protein WS71_05120 [Burkholderia mayonis]KVE57708.1 hypothetical protein WS71_26695 [Burkholderia mayonis]